MKQQRTQKSNANSQTERHLVGIRLPGTEYAQLVELAIADDRSIAHFALKMCRLGIESYTQQHNLSPKRAR